ncbi:MAG: hypothetical protein GX915_07240, partial [Clostridiales bacterium]|nr:hypothetical protein [Clostridiales bacterium]
MSLLTGMYVLPSPQETIENDGVYTLAFNGSIVINKNCEVAVNHYSKILKEDIYLYTGFSLPILRGEPMENGIYISKDNSLKEQEYILLIEPNMI